MVLKVEERPEEDIAMFILCNNNGLFT